MIPAEKKPVVAVAINDPAGIGPEITVATMMNKSVHDECKLFLIGSVPIVNRTMRIIDCDFAIHKIAHPQEAHFSWGTLDVLETGNYDCDNIEWSKVQELVGQMSLDYVMKSVELSRAGLIDVVSTTPIRKEAIKLAGCKLPGHTEIYQMEAQSDYGLTMSHVHDLRIFFVSRHMALRAAYDYASKAQMLACIRQVHHGFTALDINSPRIAVAALNPRGSDNGLFGHEEVDNLIPVVKATQKMEINAIGLVPADSVFHLGKQGHYDTILSLYYGQEHIACKTLDFERSITITFDLPFIRSFVGHGATFDITGAGEAGIVSMLESTLMATRYWKIEHQWSLKFMRITRTERWKNTC